jgi:hypothetical protein
MVLILDFICLAIAFFIVLGILTLIYDGKDIWKNGW